MQRIPLMAGLALGAVACGEVGTEPGAAAQDQARVASASAQASACHAVQLTTHTSGNFPFFAGTLSGDLEGTVQVQLGFDGINGIVFNVPGAETWEITGGVIPELVGWTVTSEFDTVQPFPSGQAPNSIIAGRSVITSGAERGQLTFHGALTPGVPSQVDLEYHGVICP